MSKELEAFENVMQICSNLKLDYLTWHDLMDSLKTIHEHLTPPTEKEVCEALSEYLGETVWFDEDKNIRVSTQWIVKRLGDVGLEFFYVLPLHLITLIGRFYEEVERKEEDDV